MDESGTFMPYRPTVPRPKSCALFDLKRAIFFKQKIKIKQMIVVLPGSYEAAETPWGRVGTLKTQR